MNFDALPYCERLAKANPKRFATDRVNGDQWFIRSDTVPAITHSGADAWEWWAFIGPLADELGIKWFNLFESFSKGTYRGSTNTLLEATFAAVCEKLEAKR